MHRFIFMYLYFVFVIVLLVLVLRESILQTISCRSIFLLVLILLYLFLMLPLCVLSLVRYSLLLLLLLLFLVSCSGLYATLESGDVFPPDLFDKISEPLLRKVFVDVVLSCSCSCSCSCFFSGWEYNLQILQTFSSQRFFITSYFPVYFLLSCSKAHLGWKSQSSSLLGGKSFDRM